VPWPFRRRRVLGRWRDPRGIAVELDAQCWYGHIRRRHPEFGSSFEPIRDTIERPTSIHQSAHFADRECYYLLGGYPAYPPLLVKVVVQRRAGSPSEVRTAHLESAISAREVRLWP
jgi:hypothetical protein